MTSEGEASHTQHELRDYGNRFIRNHHPGSLPDTFAVGAECYFDAAFGDRSAHNVSSITRLYPTVRQSCGAAAKSARHPVPSLSSSAA